ncbi:MAG TPA: hypothetical protein VNV87_03760, partial [Acidimicrobiales bacterium]|nr:hypothetical protein [Acidimicrobiales bacterium]
MIDRQSAIDRDEETSATVMAKQWHCLRLEHFQPVFDDLGPVIASSLGERATEEPSACLFGCYLQVDSGVQSACYEMVHPFDGQSLNQGPRESIEHIAASLSRRQQVWLQYFYHQVIWDQIPVLEVTLHCRSQLRTSCHFSAEQIA